MGKWIENRFGNIANVVYGKGLPKRQRNGNGFFPVLGSAGIDGSHDNYLIDFPTLIIARKGSVGNVFLMKEPSWPIDTVYYLKDVKIKLKYLFYYLKSIKFKDTSTTIPSLRRDDLESILIKYPQNFDEQRLIVSEIEKHFTRLDAAVAGLRDVKKKLEIYRKSVLKAAFEGKLTNGWRIFNKHSLKPIVADDITVSDDLPDNWVMINIEKITKIRPTKGSTPTTYGFNWRDNGVLFLRSECIKENKISLEGSKYISQEAHNSMKRSKIYPGDLLIRITGDVGLSCIFPKELKEANINQHISVIRIRDEIPISKKYLSHVFSSPQLQKYFKKITRGVTHPHLSLQQIRETPVPLAPSYEQDQIVQEIESRFSVIDKLEETVDNSLLKAKQLRKSILKAAFEGRLVQYDDNNDNGSLDTENMNQPRQTGKALSTI